MRGLVVGVVVGVAAVTGLLTGCGGGDAPSEPVSPPPTTSLGPTESTTPRPVEVTARGTVERGVEPNCLVLAADDREYLLLEAGPEVRPGVEVTVRGTTRPDLPTTCMQGTPLVVDRVESVEGGPS